MADAPHLKKAEKQEAAVRRALGQAGGITGASMKEVISYFVSFSSASPESRMKGLLPVLNKIERLQLMALPEHRGGLGGALAAVKKLLTEDEYERVISTAPGADALFKSAEAIRPPPDPDDISRTPQIDWLWMHWMVARDTGGLQALIKRARRPDPVGGHAVLLLHAHAVMPEVQEVLAKTVMNPPTVPSPTLVKIPRESVTQLGQHLRKQPGRGRSVILVGWVPGDHGGFLVVTGDSRRPPGCPEMWEGSPVLVRKPTKEEWAYYRCVSDANGDP